MPLPISATSGGRLAMWRGTIFIAEGITAPKIGVLNCEFVEVCVLRREGFEEALKAKAPGYEIVASQRCTVLDDAAWVSDQMASANPDIDAFFGEGGDAGTGAVRTVKERHAPAPTRQRMPKVAAAPRDAAGGFVF